MEVKLVAILLTVFVLFLTFKVIKHLSKILDRKWLEFIDNKALPDESNVVDKIKMSKQREEGWYKVKLEGRWACAFCSYENDDMPWWIAPSYILWLRDEDFDEIGERIEMPE